jgi:hypothetical protein
MSNIESETPSDKLGFARIAKSRNSRRHAEVTRVTQRRRRPPRNSTLFRDRQKLTDKCRRDGTGNSSVFRHAVSCTRFSYVLAECGHELQEGIKCPEIGDRIRTFFDTGSWRLLIHRARNRANGRGTGLFGAEREANGYSSTGRLDVTISAPGGIGTNRAFSPARSLLRGVGRRFRVSQVRRWPRFESLADPVPARGGRC